MAVAVRAEVHVGHPQGPEVLVGAVDGQREAEVDTGRTTVRHLDHHRLPALYGRRRLVLHGNGLVLLALDLADALDGTEDDVAYFRIGAAQAHDKVVLAVVTREETAHVRGRDRRDALDAAGHRVTVTRALEDEVVEGLQPQHLDRLVAELAGQVGLGLVLQPLDLRLLEAGCVQQRSENLVGIDLQCVSRHRHGDDRDLAVHREGRACALTPGLGAPRQFFLGHHGPVGTVAAVQERLGGQRRQTLATRRVHGGTGAYHDPDGDERRTRVEGDHFRSCGRCGHEGEQDEESQEYGLHLPASAASASGPVRVRMTWFSGTKTACTKRSMSCGVRALMLSMSLSKTSRSFSKRYHQV